MFINSSGVALNAALSSDDSNGDKVQEEFGL